MGWMETGVVDQRVRFIAAWQEGSETVSALAARFGVSRKTAHKWIGRYCAEGPAGLYDRSRAPLHQRCRVAEDVARQVIALRRARPAWGPRKLRARLVLDDPEVAWPAASTIGDLLRREGLVRPRKLRRRIVPMEHPFAAVERPNDVWCMDFKGWWKTGDGSRVEPFTVSDALSRYLLVCQAVERPRHAVVWPVLVRAFRRYGLPRAVRSDNGPPFASTSAGGLSRLGVKLIKLGVVPERIAPGKPQQNGRHERLHQTLKREAASPPSASLSGQLARLARFRRSYNHERPHEALGQIPPAQLYAPSPRIWDGRLRSPDYLKADAVRRVRRSGTIKWRGTELFVSEALTGEPVGLFAVDDDIYELRYGPIRLGHIDHEGRLRKLGARQRRRTNPENCNPSDRSEMEPM